MVIKDQVIWSKSVVKDLRRLPKHIRGNFYAWVMGVRFSGIEAMRKINGFNDELLKGNRKGQRSVRLSRAYRVIYEENSLGEIVVLEVSKHEY